MAGSHQGAHAVSFRARTVCDRGSPGSVVPDVTKAEFTSPSKGDVGPDVASTAWGEGSSGGKEGSSLHLLSLPGWRGHAVSPGGEILLWLK